MLCEELFFSLFCGGGLSGISGIFWNHPDQPHSSFPLTIWDHLESAGIIWNHLEFRMKRAFRPLSWRGWSPPAASGDLAASMGLWGCWGQGQQL